MSTCYVLVFSLFCLFTLETREFAIEVLVTLSENLPVMMKKIPDYVRSIFELLLSLMMKDKCHGKKQDKLLGSQNSMEMSCVL